MNEKYIRHAANLTSSSFSEVARFATDVYSNANNLKDDGVYMHIPDDISKEEALERNSINYIKRSIINGGYKS